MIDGLAPVHLALSAVLVLWNILVAGRIANVHDAPRPLAILSAFGGLLIAPALIVTVATTSILYGRALDAVTWIWPVTATVIAAQAILATRLAQKGTSRAITIAIALPIAIYDIVIAAAAWVRYADARVESLPNWLLAIPGSEAATLAIIGGSHALVSAAYLHIPILAPAFRARWSASLGARLTIAAYATVWATGFAWGAVRSERAVREYAKYDATLLRERPGGRFAIGLHILPALSRAPYPVVLARDLRLVDTLGVRAVSLTITPAGARRSVLDSLARVLDPLRRDSVLLLVRVGYPPGIRMPGAVRPELLGATRVAAIREIARRLRPDVLFPAPEPYGEGARAVGSLPMQRWADFFNVAARTAGEVAPNVAIGMLVTAVDARDSALYAWAAADGGPIDVIGFSVTPSSRGPRGLDARTSSFDRWMAATPTEKPQWVYVAGAPAAHGERNQGRAIWAGMVWATSLPRARGVVAIEAGDYGALRGIRRVDGNLRPAAGVVRRAGRTLRELGP